MVVFNVEHHRLTPASDEPNKLTSICPECKEGLLLCVRHPETMLLEPMDTCTLCGARFRYVDIDNMREKDWAGGNEP